MEVRFPEPGDILYVAAHMRESDRAEIGATQPEGTTVALFSEMLLRVMGPLAWCAVRSGRPVACMGARELWPGVYQAWMFATDDFAAIAFSLTRAVRRVMMPAVVAAGAHRVQAFSASWHVEAHRWMESFGARRESTLRAFGQDRTDFYVYRWLDDEGRADV